jgi:hypothetical protein
MTSRVPQVGEHWFIRDGVDHVFKAEVLGTSDDEYIVEYYDYPVNRRRIKRRDAFISLVPIVPKPEGFWAAFKRVMLTDD